jgi:PAS domain S-box-containing protein
MKRWMPDLHSLSAQMILSFVALVLLTAAAAGVPAIWLVRDQLVRQAWAQVEHGSIAAQALYQARQSELAGLATLTAQRPTLRGLLAQREPDELSAYLRTLREGSGLDLILLCADGQAVSQAGKPFPNPCAGPLPSSFYVVPAGTSSQAWLLAAHSIQDEAAGELGTVVVGIGLNDEFVAQMHAQTGLEHTLVIAGQAMATSLIGRRSTSVNLDEAKRSTFRLDGRSYYAIDFSLGETGLEAEVALEVTDVTAAQRHLVWTLLGGIATVTVVASLVGTFLARRIGWPLIHLAGAADSISRGDLDTPLTVEARVREVALVAHALEGARVDLKRSLAELRQEKAWTDHLLEAIVEGIVTLDRRGHITFFSHGAERITGWQREQVVGQTCDRVFKPAESDEPFSKLIPPPGQRRKISVELQDGRTAILAVSGARLFPPERGDARVALVFRDISEEEAVHQLLGHFLANVAHEFRTPLSALAASVELLLDQTPDLTPLELGELLTSLHLGVLGLQTLIDNLLESASIETGHFRVHPHACNLGDIIAEAIDMMQPILDKHGQSLVVELPAAMPVIQADPRRTVQVLINLLSNASKYGPDDAEIEICVTARKRLVRIAVADSGPGIPAEYRNNLFRRFVHASPENDKAQVGVGLGLSVVKAIVEASGGQVGIEGREGSGSIFWFTLPVANEP